MATVSEISAANNYGGNAALGGAAPGAVNLDTRPLESLAHYTFFYNKNIYEAKQKEANDRAQELAELSKFNPDAALPQDKAAAIDAWNRIVAFGNDYARKPLTGQAKDNLKNQWDFASKIKSTQSLVSKIQKRSISYSTQKAAIDARTDITEGQKAAMLKDLDKYAATDATVDIPVLPAFDEKIPEIKPASLQQLETSTNLGNQILSVKMDIFNPKVELGRSDAEALGFDKLFVSPNSDQYKNATEGQKRQYDFAAQSNNNFKFWSDAENVLASAMNDPKYQKDGRIDFSAIAASNPMLNSIFGTVDKYNAWAKDMTAQATKGAFKDHLGRELKVINPISPDSFPTIDKEKPLSASQIIMLQKWAASPKLVIKEEQIQNTNEALTKRGQDLDYAAAMARLKAAGGEQVSDYQPFQSIVASVGGVNKQVPLNKLSSAQVGAISPALLNEKGQVKNEYQNFKVAVGTNTNNEFGVFLYDASGKKAAPINERLTEDQLKAGVTPVTGTFSGEMITPSTILSNASSWLATFGKETKNQDAYRFEPNAFTNSFNNDLFKGSKKAQAPSAAKVVADPTLDNDTSNWKVLPNGNWQYIDGTIYNSKGKKIK